MKILQVIPYFPPARTFGGPPKVAYDFSLQLAKKGHEVIVFTSDALSLTARMKIKKAKLMNGIEVYYFRNLSMKFVQHSKLFLTPGMIPEMKRKVKEVDIVHLHEYRTFQNIVASYYVSKFKIPYIIQAHGSIPRIGRTKRKIIFDYFFGYKILKNSAKALALTETEIEEYRIMGVPSEKIEILPNGIDLSEYRELPEKNEFKEKFNIPNNAKIVLYLGRIHKSKRVDLLVRAFSFLVKKINKNTNIVLVIAGPDDGDMARIKRIIYELNIARKIIITGYLNKNDKIKALVDADVLVIPAFKGFPLTLLEACATGTPIVVTTLGDYLSWIDNNVGYQVKPKVRDLAEAIYRIINDNEIHRLFSNKCIELVQKQFSINVVVSKLERIYDNILKEF